MKSFAQQDTLFQPTKFEKTRIKHSVTKDPNKLAIALTEGLTDEKEKFDALFTWVVMNIDYDNRSYNSGVAFSSQKNVKKILKRRKGICADYTHLMDTLCAVVGIQNVTISGYVKEVNFDIHDSLFFDTHAWSAVKLKGLWYLYDPTWCSGSSSYSLTNLGNWRKKVIKKQREKGRYITVELLTKKKKRKRHKYCPIPNYGSGRFVTVWALPRIAGIIINVVDFAPYIRKEKYESIANTKYYLSNPDYFALNHFPSNPIWSFTQRIGSTSQFFADSVYYDRSKIDSSYFQRNGTFCLECDSYYFSDRINRERLTASASLSDNPNNRFIPALYYLEKAQIFFRATLKEKDSLLKMNLRDSTNYYLDTCRIELKSSGLNNQKEYKLQSNKNKEKRKELLAQNKSHKSVATTIYKESSKRKSRMNSLYNKANAYDKRGVNLYKSIDRLLRQSSSGKNLKEEKKVMLLNEMKTNTAISDSLTNQIAMIQDSFVNHTFSLWENILKQQSVVNPLLQYFDIDSDLRGFFIQDSYDKVIRDLRIKLNAQEDSVLSSVNSDIFTLTDSIYNQFVLMNNLSKQRNSINIKSAKIMYTLSDAGIVTKDSTKFYKTSIKQMIREDICSNVDNMELIFTVKKDFQNLLDEMKYLQKMIQYNDKAEQARFTAVNEHLLLNKKRISSAIKSNTLMSKEMRRELQFEIAKYLKDLKNSQNM